MDEKVALYIINGLLAVVCWFLSTMYKELKERIKNAEDSVSKIKDGTVKKEDFREFKEELWLRFDRMEIAFERRIKEQKE